MTVTFSPEVAAFIRVAAAALAAVMLVAVLRRGGATHTILDARVISVVAMMIVLGVIAFSGLVAALGLPVAPALLSTLYTGAAAVAAAIIAFWLWRGR